MVFAFHNIFYIFIQGVIMKVSYFAYGFHRRDTEEKSLGDIRPFLRSFCKFDDQAFKNKFVYNDENVYLIHYIDDVYYFLMTRNSDIIRKINSDSFSVEDIQASLESNEHIGFVSYVYVDKDFIGFASSIFAPKCDVFGWFVNKLISSIYNGETGFYLHPIMHTASKHDALEFTHIGKTVIEIDKENPLLHRMADAAGFSVESSIDLGSIEIHVKPLPRRKITEATKDIIRNLPDEGVKKFYMKAQVEAGSQMQDMYLVGAGSVSDIISQKEDSKIAEALQTKARTNPVLRSKLYEYKQEEVFTGLDVADILCFDKSSAWSNYFYSLQ